jgi:hypothetical protein
MQVPDASRSYPDEHSHVKPPLLFAQVSIIGEHGPNALVDVNAVDALVALVASRARRKAIFFNTFKTLVAGFKKLDQDASPF